MSATDGGGAENLALLQRMLQKRPPAGERCDFCASPLAPEHDHLVELVARRILCACRPCAIVFEPEGAAQGRYRRVPARYAEIPEFNAVDALWDALAIPIGLAFFFYNSLEKKMLAFYPSPAGATESLLPLDAWNEAVAATPALGGLEPDVEAIVIRRARDASRAFLVPIDAAYELVGIIRRTWKGFDGGEDAHRGIEAYFDDLVERCKGRTPARIS